MAFRFEALLKMRRSTEDQRKKEMADINRHLRGQKDRLDSMMESLAASKESLRANIQKQVHPETLVLYDRYFQRVKSFETRHRQIISEIEAHREYKRKELVDAMRKRRTMEFLKEREFQERTKRHQKIETALMDEIGSNQWRRRET